MISAAMLLEHFKSMYPGTPTIARAPGRVNLIGEHTDYNDGFVMPLAIDYYTWVAIRFTDNGRIRVRSLRTEASGFEISANELHPTGKWSDYVVGVLAQLFDRGDIALRGADILVYGEVPIGAGLSSSAALEVATGFAAIPQGEHTVSREDLARICQKAENVYVGAQCGIMDQFIACHGVAGHAVLLDCRSLEYSLLPIPAGIRIVLCNSMIKHSLASGEYNLRRQECSEGVKILSRSLPGIGALRDISLDALEKYSDSLPRIVARRCRHVVTENLRVLEAAEALQAGQLDALGRLMYASHESLRLDYEVSCDELDALVNFARMEPGVYGARMTGGGFGGCTVNIVEQGQVEAFASSVKAKYHAMFQRVPEIYVCNSADGVCEAP